MSDPLTLKVYKGWARTFGIRLLNGGSPIDLTGGVYVCGIEKEQATAFCRFRMTGHGTSGVLSGTVPCSIAFTGQGTLRVWKSGSPRTLVGDSMKVNVLELSSNWLTG